MAVSEDAPVDGSVTYRCHRCGNSVILDIPIRSLQASEVAGCPGEGGDEGPDHEYEIVEWPKGLDVCAWCACSICHAEDCPGCVNLFDAPPGFRCDRCGEPADRYGLDVSTWPACILGMEVLLGGWEPSRAIRLCLGCSAQDMMANPHWRLENSNDMTPPEERM